MSLESHYKYNHLGKETRTEERMNMNIRDKEILSPSETT